MSRETRGEQISLLLGHLNEVVEEDRRIASAVAAISATVVAGVWALAFNRPDLLVAPVAESMSIADRLRLIAAWGSAFFATAEGTYALWHAVRSVPERDQLPDELTRYQRSHAHDARRRVAIVSIIAGLVCVGALGLFVSVRLG